MVWNPTRRNLLQTLGGIAAAGTVGTRVAGASPVDDRYIVKTSSTDVSTMQASADVVHDLRNEIDYLVVEASESAIPASATYAPDIEIELAPPAADQASTLNVPAPSADPLYDLQWDKKEQLISQVHNFATGEGARIGVLDDGILGANPDSDASHPDLPNVRADFSRNFTDDGQGPGPLNGDHGTHAAGTAAAVDNDLGVVGIAPSAELVSLRVFSGLSASFSDIIAAVVYGATSNSEGGAGCDVLNLSLGTPPLLPVAKPPDEIDAGDDPDGDRPITPINASDLAVQVNAISAAGTFATNSGSLPVASAGNDGVNLDRVYGDQIDVELDSGTTVSFDGSTVVLPAEATDFMSIGAAGPIGFGWPLGPLSEDVAPGITIEKPIQTELPSEEPANYTNYGADAIDVIAGGGNVDTDAIDQGVSWFYDLVFSTAIGNLKPDAPEDIRLDTYEPDYAWKAGTSFAAPNVAGFAALLVGENPDAAPTAIRERIESSAQLEPVGRGGETTAPDQSPNESADGDFDGDQLSSPGANVGFIDPETYRGEGHIDILPAILKPINL